jgi:glyoxylase-like metal-dependent hydrolase (beta-lactamase superfamily II)
LIPTPGHTVGHVAFFRPTDRVLIAGDAVLTTPLGGLIPQLKKISPPPRLPSWNWQLAKTSVARLALLEPHVLASGHGLPAIGERVAHDLRDFADHFSHVSIDG